jgi:hypothetical protein
MICTGSTGYPLGKKVHVAGLEKLTELFKSSEAKKRGIDFARTVPRGTFGKLGQGAFFGKWPLKTGL